MENKESKNSNSVEDFYEQLNYLRFNKNLINIIFQYSYEFPYMNELKNMTDQIYGRSLAYLYYDKKVIDLVNPGNYRYRYRYVIRKKDGKYWIAPPK